MFKGAITALVTPFNEHGIDFAGLSANIEWQIREGIHGFMLPGSVGETGSLKEQEREQLIAHTVQAASKRVPVIVNVSHSSTEIVIERVRQAQKLGADGLLVSTPYYNKPPQQGIYLHFKAIAENTSLPICVYNIPCRTGTNIETATLEKIADLPNIRAVKEASGNIGQINDVINQICRKGRNFNVLSGDDLLAFPVLALGGHGVISTISNLLPKEVSALVGLVNANKFVEARELHHQLSPLIKLAFVETNPIPIKYAMSLCGLAAGPCRLPLCELQPENKQKIAQLLKHMQLLP